MIRTNHQSVAAFEAAIRAEIARKEARGEIYDPTETDAPITAPLPSEDALTAGLTTQAIRRDTARMTAEERRERLAETIVTNGLRRQAAFALERDHYCALGIAA